MLVSRDVCLYCNTNVSDIKHFTLVNYTYLLGWSLWWKFEVKTLFQATVKWDLDNVTAKSHPKGRYMGMNREMMCTEIHVY